MLRRSLFFSLALAPFLRAAASRVRGLLTIGVNAFVTSQGRRVQLTGDEPTLGVLKDDRLAGADFEAYGAFESPSRFRIDPIHTRNLFVWKNSKKFMVTYWCEVCAIRTYTPGECMCCQEKTELDLRDPDLPATPETK